jgi:hypothetical protein
MGREATTIAHWNGQSGSVKAVLESTELILRGDIRTKIARSVIHQFDVTGDALTLTTADNALVLELGSAEAQKWANALAKPPPTLAQKLGIDLVRRAFVLGQVNDEALKEALVDATTEDPQTATIIVAVLISERDLTAAIHLGREMPECAIWCVSPKGKTASITDHQIRHEMRASGYIDTKTSGVSDKLTATRYQLRASG